MAKSVKRIYIAVPVGNDLSKEAKTRLVNCGTPAAARLHVTKSLYDVRVATSHEVAQQVKAGADVEEAGDGVTEQLPGTTTA